MAIERSLTAETFQELRDLAGEAEYIGHQTALYLLGQIPRMPDTITIVSPRRRRNRDLGTRRLVFVFHPPDRLKPVQFASIGNHQLPVSSLEKTLIDLLADLAYAPPLEELSGLFCRLPYLPGTLLQLAAATSDSVLKRTAFLLSWAGRISEDEIPFPTFSRTPVKLDPRIDDAKQLWDRRFFIKFPRMMLEKFPSDLPHDSEPSLRDWMELRRFLPFLLHMQKTGFFPIRQASSFSDGKFLEDFFSPYFQSISRTELIAILLDFAITMDPEQSGKIPMPIKHRLLCDHSILDHRRNDLTPWVLDHLHSMNISLVGTAIHFGHALGLHEQVLKSLGKNSHRLFNAGRFNTLREIGEEYTGGGYPAPAPLYVFMARTYARQGLFDRALDILDKGKLTFETKDTNETDLGELAYATGNIFRHLGKFHEAATELFLAREYFSTAGDLRGIGLTDFALGNVFFARGRPRDAKNFYVSTFTKMKELGLRDAQASALANIGLVEYDCGNLRKANIALQRAGALHRMLKNSWNEGVIDGSRGKVLLTMGHFAQAMKVFKEGFRLKKKQKHEIGAGEFAALLGWTSELIGRMGSSRAWWDNVPADVDLQIEPRALFVIKGLRAMSALFRRDLPQADTLYRELHRFAIEFERSQIALADALHGVGFALTLQGDPSGSDFLKQALAGFSDNLNRVQVIELEILAKSYYPTVFPEISLGESIKRFFTTNAFDPFWGLYAHQLLQEPTPSIHEYLAYHLQKTPPGMTAHFVKRIPGFPEALGKITVGRQRASEFLTLLTDGSSQPIHLEDYQTWRERIPPTHFFLDGPVGMIGFSSNTAHLKPDSISHGLLTSLLAAYPHPVDLEVLYQSVWKTSFDPDCDLGAMKSALQRLQMLLKSVNPAIRLRRRRGKSLHGGIDIVLACRWEAVI
jgi:tetratricopeptide (TPR) repeat protein